MLEQTALPQNTANAPLTGRQALLPSVEPAEAPVTENRAQRKIDFGHLFPLAKVAARGEGITLSAYVKRAVAAALNHPAAPAPAAAEVRREDRVKFQVDTETHEFIQRAAAAEQLSVDAWCATLLRRISRSHRGLFPAELEALEQARTEFAEARRELTRALAAGVDLEVQAAMEPLVGRVDGYYNRLAGVLRMIDLERLERLHGKSYTRR